MQKSAEKQEESKIYYVIIKYKCQMKTLNVVNCIIQR